MSSAPHSFQSAVGVGAWVLAEHRASRVGDLDVAVKPQQFYQYYPNA
jgi:hypothetical protein